MCIGVPGEVRAVTDPTRGIAAVDVAGVLRSVNIGLLDGVTPGDWVLVHMGFALNTLDPDEVRERLAMLDAAG